MVLYFLTSCAQLQYDTTTSFPLLTVSESKTPALEDVRNFVQCNDLVYTAAGSGGILVYRIVGDSMDPILPLSLTNLYSEELEQVYVRTVEIVQTLNSTNLVFSYDTLGGGGIGVAEISSYSTKPLGSLRTEPSLRIKQTVTSFNPQDNSYRVLIASENLGVVSYDLSFVSNNYFEQPKIAALVDYIAQLDIERPAQQFLSLDAPNLASISNANQISNLQNLIQLSLDNPQMVPAILSNIPFLTTEQRNQIQGLLTSGNKSLISNVLRQIQNNTGEDVFNQIMSNPQMLNNIFNAETLSGLVPQIGDLKNNLDKNIYSNLEAQLDTSGLQGENLQNVLSLSGIQQVIQSSSETQNTDIIELPPQVTETLFEESLLSNMSIASQIESEASHDENHNPFINRRDVGDAGVEIQQTVEALGRRFFVPPNENVKNRLFELNSEELQSLFQSLFQQASSAISLIPLLESSGINIRELYDFWLQGDYTSIIEGLDSSIIAELLRKLPRYQINTTLQVVQTNLPMSVINSMSSDAETLYLAMGQDGFAVVDRVSSKVISLIKRPFSDVTMVKPYRVYGRNYYIVTDRLDGLVIYERRNNRKVGEQVARISLVGESMAVYPYEDILWVADGSNGVLAVRFNKDKSFSIEAELYQKQGIAYYIGSARRREVLASYGPDGLKRLRITNVSPDDINSNNQTLAQNDTTATSSDVIDRILNWGLTSSTAQFFRRMFFL